MCKKCIHENALANNDKLPHRPHRPHRCMKKIIEANKKALNLISRDPINAAYFWYKKNLEEKGVVRGLRKPS